MFREVQNFKFENILKAQFRYLTASKDSAPSNII